MAKASDILKVARAEIGTTEYPPRSNNVKYNTEYYGEEVYGDDEYPWCMAFVWWCFKHANASELFYGGGRTASCPALARHAKARNQWVTSDYKPGDVLIYNFNKYDQWDYEHTGILEEVDGTAYIVIEGNTSESDDDNGGAVMRRRRYDSQIIGAYRPKYEIEKEEDEEDMVRYERLSDVPNTWGQRDMIEKLMNAGIIAGDGSDPHGNNDKIDLSEDMVRMLAFNYRGGCYDDKFEAAGLERVVK